MLKHVKTLHVIVGSLFGPTNVSKFILNALKEDKYWFHSWVTVGIKGCILECGGLHDIEVSRQSSGSFIANCFNKQTKIKRKQLRHTKIQRLKDGESARTSKNKSNYGENSEMHDQILVNLGVRQATTSKMPIRIDPRMKRNTFLVDRLVCFLFCESMWVLNEASKWQWLVFCKHQHESKIQVQIRFWSSWNWVHSLSVLKTWPDPF